ncbi:MAG: hypothetical protein KGZ92_09125 [Firmicutes bacterium]|nr:hypothetical protein [Dethiobacter sp.]MBS3889424.1 hypothetical protein [Bacillota bacterium]
MIGGFIKGIEARPLVLDEFDEKLWVVAVETVRVMPDGGLLFQFKNGAGFEDSQKKCSPYEALKPVIRLVLNFIWVEGIQVDLLKLWKQQLLWRPRMGQIEQCVLVLIIVAD